MDVYYSKVKVLTVILRCSLLLLVLLSSQTLAAEKSDPDFAFTKTYHYKIKKRKSHYVLSSKVQESRILISERAKYSSNFYVYEGSASKVDHLSARLNGKKLKKGRVGFHYQRPKDIFFAQDKVHSISFPTTIKIGDSLSYKFERKFSDIAYLPIIRVPNIDYIKRFEVIYEHPKEFQVDFEFFFPRDEIPYRILREEKRTSLIFDSIPGELPLPYYNYNDILAAALVTVKVGGVSVTPTSVNEFVNWYSKLASLQPQLQDSDKTILADELNQVSSVTEKLTLIHDYVRKNIRYIGIEDSAHTIVPHEPATVLEKQYGDCKDRACLVSAIASEHGIPVQMALVSSSWYLPFEGEHVSHYNHMICYYEAGDSSVYFDPTARRWAFETIPESIIGAHTLILDPKTPSSGSLFSYNKSISLEIDLEAHIDSLENSSGTATLSNSYLSLALYSRAELTASEARRKILNGIGSSLRGVKIDSLIFLDKSESSMMVAFRADLSSFVIKTQRRAYLPSAPFVVVDNEALAREDDSLPLMFESLEGVTLSLTLTTPGMEIKADSLILGENSDTTSSALVDYQYTSSIRMIDSSNVRAEYSFTRSKKIFSGAEKSHFLKFCKDYLGEKKNMYPLNWINK